MTEGRSDDRAGAPGSGFIERLTSLLPGILGAVSADELRDIASRFEEVSLEADEVLYRRGEAGNSLHLVIAGRLQSRRQNPLDSTFLVSQIVSGDTVGVATLITGEPHTGDVVAVRDTILARLSSAAFDLLVEELPAVGVSIARHAMRAMAASASSSASGEQVQSIAIVGLDDQVPLEEFGRRLELALLRFGSTLYLDSKRVQFYVGEAGRNHSHPLQPGDPELIRLVDQAERNRRFIIYQADREMTGWNRMCLHQADRILLVAHHDSSRELRPIEQDLFSGRSSRPADKKLLILLHRDQDRMPTDTASWLEHRDVGQHLHVAFAKQLGLNRLARFLAGRAVGLVLGGGGARGFAHIGAIRALRETGIPIDLVGGSSIGAVIAATYAMGWDDGTILSTIKRAFVDDRPLSDFTPPLFGVVKGDKIADGFRRYTGNIEIPDLWIPHFSISTNLTRSSVAEHRSGMLWRALRASVSLPGILHPVLIDGELHVDGGVLDNLPVRRMKCSPPGLIIAVDVSVRSEAKIPRDKVPTTLEWIRDRFSKDRVSPGFPLLTSVVVKSMTVAGSEASRVDIELADFYINPPLREFELLGWNRIYELVEVGYRHTLEQIPAFIAAHPEVVRRDEILESMAGHWGDGSAVDTEGRRPATED